jgi:hypothetical protein
MSQTATVGSIVLSEDRSQVSRWPLTASSKGCASTRQDRTVNLSMGAAPDGKAELPRPDLLECPPADSRISRRTRLPRD